jgi:hypothetical protein
VSEALHAWHEFYLLVGSAAAALTGLMFVVVSISPGTIATRPAAGIRAFITPTIVFYATVLVVSALMLAPHAAPRLVAILLALGGLAGLAYMVWIDAHRQWRRSKLGLDDWYWYVAQPALGYVLLVAAGIALWLRLAAGAWLVALSAVLLLVVGIRNGWDLAIWMAQNRKE